ncbi:O52N2 protein, partial [Polypterus senegalus]|nr:O52N2 protein [Polypterus senegalus]
IPKILQIVLFNVHAISFHACFFQMFIVLCLSAMESGVLAVMAYDRYVAICNPLRYTSILTPVNIVKILLVVFLRCIILTAIFPVLASRLPYCSNSVHQCYCDHIPVVRLSCADITLNNIYGLFVAFLVVGMDLVYISFTYVMIIRTVFKLASRTARVKAVSTCGPHFVVILYSYTSSLCTYLFNRFGQNQSEQVIVITAIFYLILPSVLNPVVYAIRAKEIRDGFVKHFLRKTICFSGLEVYYHWLSLAFIIIFSFAIIGNITVICVIKLEETLHTPMYIFLCVLAIIDIGLCVSTIPKILQIVLFNVHTISFHACFFQMFIVLCLSAMESGVLAAMAYDRYVAICNPLRYTSILTPTSIAKILLAVFLRCIILTAMFPVLTSRLPYCSNVVHQCYCDHIPVAKLSCADITLNNIYGLFAAFMVIGMDLVYISFTYFMIIRAVLNLASKAARVKAFSTCGPHFIVILYIYISSLSTYLINRFGQNQSQQVTVISTIFYLIMPSVLNPFVYAIRAKEIRNKRMQSFNASLSMPDFLLEGFSGLEVYYHWLSLAFIVIFSFAIIGNITIICVIKLEETLHTPMYIFLCVLAIIDIGLCVSTIPKILQIVLFNVHTISFHACFFQMFIVMSLCAMESGVLAAMAYDRYVAICNPLRYTSILTPASIAKILLAVFLRCIILTAVYPVLMSRLSYCSNVVHQCYCDHIPVAKLSCADITLNNIYGLFVAFMVVGMDLLYISFSYFMIIRAVLNLASKAARVKAFSTCGPHFIVILYAYISSLSTFLIHRFGQNQSQQTTVLTTIFHLIMPSVLNPFVYAIRAKEIRTGFMKCFLR